MLELLFLLFIQQLAYFGGASKKQYDRTGQKQSLSLIDIKVNA